MKIGANFVIMEFHYSTDDSKNHRQRDLFPLIVQLYANGFHSKCQPDRQTGGKTDRQVGRRADSVTNRRKDNQVGR
jgi:hypothetical protein